MPTILNLFGLRFYFYSREHQPIHVHVESSDGIAKYEIEQEVKLLENKGVKPKDLKLAEAILEDNRENLVNEWNKYFSEE